jgi:hypothetical protein
MLTFLLGAFVLYIVVRVAAKHGVRDVEQSRLSRERFEAFEQKVESGALPNLTVADRPEAL